MFSDLMKAKCERCGCDISLNDYPDPPYCKKCYEFLNAQYEAEVKAWKEKWPDYCPDCMGSGGDYISGDRECPPDFDACSSCIEEEKCPRCGGDFPNDGNGFMPCPHCGWNWGKNPDDTCPPHFLE